LKRRILVLRLLDLVVGTSLGPTPPPPPDPAEELSLKVPPDDLAIAGELSDVESSTVIAGGTVRAKRPLDVRKPRLLWSRPGIT